jgi:hypothetical protein
VAKPNAAEKGGSRVSPDWDFATRPCDKEKETSRLQHKETLAFALFFPLIRALLFIRVLENHVFLDPEIERSITARHVLNRRCRTASLFKFCITKILFIGPHGQEF